MGWTVRGANPGAGEIFRKRPYRSRGAPLFLYSGYRVVALTTHLHLAPRLKKEYSYTLTPSMVLNDLLQNALCLYPWSPDQRYVPFPPFEYKDRDFESQSAYVYTCILSVCLLSPVGWCPTVNRLLIKNHHQIPSDSRFQKVILNCNKREDIILKHDYTGCPGRNVKNFGRVFLMLKYLWKSCTFMWVLTVILDMYLDVMNKV
jgi:hypothetical protein